MDVECVKELFEKKSAHQNFDDDDDIYIYIYIYIYVYILYNGCGVT